MYFNFTPQVVCRSFLWWPVNSSKPARSAEAAHLPVQTKNDHRIPPLVSESESWSTIAWSQSTSIFIYLNVLGSANWTNNWYVIIFFNYIIVIELFCVDESANRGQWPVIPVYMYAIYRLLTACLCLLWLLRRRIVSFYNIPIDRASFMRLVVQQAIDDVKGWGRPKVMDDFSWAWQTWNLSTVISSHPRRSFWNKFMLWLGRAYFQQKQDWIPNHSF